MVPARFTVLAAYAAAMPLAVTAAGVWGLPAVVAWLEGAGAWKGPLFTLAAAAGLALALVPANAAAVLAGALFGLAGLAPAVLAYLAAAAAAFEVVRRRLQPAVQAAVGASPRAAAVQSMLAASGLRLVVLARLAPSVPFPLVNVLLGASPVSRAAYLGGTVLGMLPRTAILVAIGTAAEAVLPALRAGRLPPIGDVRLGGLFGILGLAATAALAALVAVAVRRALGRHAALGSSAAG